MKDTNTASTRNRSRKDSAPIVISSPAVAANWRGSASTTYWMRDRRRILHDLAICLACDVASSKRDGANDRSTTDAMQSCAAEVPKRQWAVTAALIYLQGRGYRSVRRMSF